MTASRYSMESTASPNKDRREDVHEFLDKLEDALPHGIHVLLVDLIPAGRYEKHGMHCALWKKLGDEPEAPPADEPLTLAAYVADTPVKAHLERVAVGDVLSDMPIFLDPDTYVNAPLEPTYQATWKGTPARWRSVLERRTPVRRKR